MLAVGRRFSTQVDGHVEYRAARDADQLVLRPRRDLEVEPAQHPLVHGERMIVLHETGVDAVGGQFTQLERLREETA